MKIVLPEKVKFIIETLETHGYESYAVGETGAGQRNICRKEHSYH